jgi:hypothetical protein
MVLPVKFGALRDWWGRYGFRARPLAVRNYLAYSVGKLGVEHVDR